MPTTEQLAQWQATVVIQVFFGIFLSSGLVAAIYFVRRSGMAADRLMNIIDKRIEIQDKRRDEDLAASAARMDAQEKLHREQNEKTLEAVSKSYDRFHQMFEKIGDLIADLVEKLDRSHP